MATQTIRVEGLRELQRAFRLAGTGIDKDLREGLKSAAEPVRADAENLTRSRISGMRRGVIPWHSMRTGITHDLVYVVPAQRGIKGRGRERFRRRNIAPLIVERAFGPAMNANRARVLREVDDLLEDMARLWERA